MKVIDGHVFLGESIYMRLSTEVLVSSMDMHGVDMCAVVAPPPGPYYSDANKLVLNACQKHPDRLVPVYRANPQLEGEAENVGKALKKQGFVGVQLDPTNDGYGVGSEIMEPVVKKAEEHGAPVYIHSGDSIFCPPEFVADFASKFERVNFITNMSRRAPRVAQGCDNLYLLSRPFPTLAFQRGHATRFNIDRLIFASDTPLGSIEIESKRVELAGLKPDQRSKIMGGNIQRIMKI